MAGRYHHMPPSMYKVRYYSEKSPFKCMEKFSSDELMWLIASHKFPIHKAVLTVNAFHAFHRYSH